jgi:hypothetical protein
VLQEAAVQHARETAGLVDELERTRAKFKSYLHDETLRKKQHAAKWRDELKTIVAQMEVSLAQLGSHGR